MQATGLIWRPRIPDEGCEQQPMSLLKETARKLHTPQAGAKLVTPTEGPRQFRQHPATSSRSWKWCARLVGFSPTLHSLVVFK